MTAAEKFWRAAFGEKDNSVRMVVLHNCHRVEIPTEFFNYYVEMRLLRVYPKWPELGFLKFGLKAKVDKVNGGLRFWVKKLEPIDEYAPQSSYYYSKEMAWYLIESDGTLYTKYDSIQRCYRQRRTGQSPTQVEKTFKECGMCKKPVLVANYKLATWSGFCADCRNTKAYRKMRDSAMAKAEAYG